MSAASDEMAERIRMALGARPDIVEKRIVGGIGFMLNGNLMAGTAEKGKLMVRVDPARTADILGRPGARQMQMAGRPMEGYIIVEDEGTRKATDFVAWLKEAEAFVGSLPAK
jgi:hypothetical protein